MLFRNLMQGAALPKNQEGEVGLSAPGPGEGTQREAPWTVCPVVQMYYPCFRLTAGQGTSFRSHTQKQNTRLGLPLFINQTFCILGVEFQ